MTTQASGSLGDLLVVDDEESVLLTMQAILEASGHRTAAAGTRAEALAVLERRAFDVVVSDLHLDEGDGLEVIAEAKRRSPTTTGIILTGYGSFEAVTRALRAGVDDFLVKPTDVEELKRSIERCVRKSREAQRLAAAAQEAEEARRAEEEARRAEEALRQSEQRFRLLADAAPIMIWAAGPDGQCAFLNRRWLEFTGRSLEEALGEAWLNGIHPDDQERCREVYRQAIERRAPFHTEYRLRRADGEYRWVEDDGVPYETPEGAFGGFIGACSDVTERRQAVLEREAQLQHERTARVEAEVEAELARAEAEAAEEALKAGRGRAVPGTTSPPSQPPTPSLPLPPRQAPPKPPTSAVGLVRKRPRPSPEFPKPPSSVPSGEP